jgi:hypothetical protein
MVVEGATWILEHLVVLALQLDRPLHPGETVWHISGERSNNNPDNLVLVASQQALTRVLSGQPLLRDDLVWRPPWTESLKRDEIVRRALAGTAG